MLAATDDRALNRTVSQLCRERSIPVNVADDKELCTFLFPSILRRGPLSVGVSTGGASPTAAAYVRRTLEAQLPDCLEDILTWLEGQRTALVQSLPQAGRGELLSPAVLRRTGGGTAPVPGGDQGAAGAGARRITGQKNRRPLGRLMEENRQEENGMNTKCGCVYLVGAGCGSAEWMTLRGFSSASDVRRCGL